MKKRILERNNCNSNMMDKMQKNSYTVHTDVNTSSVMPFEWDEQKNAINIEKHGIDFVDAVDIFNHPMLELLDTREQYDEERYIAIGIIKSLVGVVVYVERHEDVLRIISARKATKREVKCYEQTLKD
jgi:uncharacterized protein